MSGKINVLVICSDRTGVANFRSVGPHIKLEQLFPDDFHIDIDYKPNIDNEDFLKKYQIIHFHRTFGPYEQMERRMGQLRKLGVKTIMDIDDYWKPTMDHPAYQLIVGEGLDKKISGNLSLPDYVMTTTPIFAGEISKFNKNVVVIPNAIDPTERQFIPENLPKQTDRVRVGFLGGSSHLADLEIISGAINQLHAVGYDKKTQFVVCGFDIRGEITEFNPKTKERKKRKIQPHETIWVKYERIFTDNYKIISDQDYIKHLQEYSKEPYADEGQPYRRIWTKPVTTYAKNYNLFDISLAPLKEHTFNLVKCIVGDSLISTNKGFKHISDIVDQKLSLQTEIDGKFNEIVNHFKYENVPTIKITMNDGYEIEGTPHHQIFINNEWVQLQDLKIGDKIKLTRPIFSQTEYQEITYPMLLTKNITQEKINNSDENMLPRIRINENWGRLLGYMLGDGNYNGNSISITCDKRHTNVVEDIVSLYKSIGLNPLVRDKKPDKRCSNSLAKEGFGVSICSTCINFLSIAKKYGWCGSHGKTFRVPKVILESPKSVIREFLRGLFESDGTVGEHSPVSLTSKDLKLIKQIQTLLLGFGIQGFIRYSYNKHYRKYYYRLDLHREGCEIFYNEIGFISQHKCDHLYKMISGKRSNHFIPQTFTDSIKTIENTINTVYDIEVDSVHMYNANGIINHNSQLKCVEAAFHKKALIAQDFGPYTIDLKNAYVDGHFTKDGNALLVPSIKNHKLWFKYLKLLIDNPSFVTDMAEKLHEDITPKYNLEKVTRDRAEFYKSIIN